MSYHLDSILQLLNPDNTMSANRLLAHAIGLCETIIYSALISKYTYYINKGMIDEGGWFFSTVDDLQESTTYGEKPQRTAIKHLIENNLIECKVKGIPAKRYFRISDNIQKLKSLIDKGVEIAKKLKERSSKSKIKSNIEIISENKSEEQVTPEQQNKPILNGGTSSSQMAELDTPERQNKELPKGGVKPNINKPNIINLISNQSIYPQVETKKEDKIDEKKEKAKKEMSYSEMLRNIGSVWCNNPYIQDEEAFRMDDVTERKTSSCKIPYSFIENPNALKSALKFLLAYSYRIEPDNRYNNDTRPLDEKKRSKRFADRTIESLIEIITSEEFKHQGKLINPETVIDKINEVNQDCDLYSWMYEWECEWQDIMTERDNIKNQNAYFKACVWSSLRDYLDKSDNISMYYSNLLLAR